MLGEGGSRSRSPVESFEALRVFFMAERERKNPKAYIPGSHTMITNSECWKRFGHIPTDPRTTSRKQAENIYVSRVDVGNHRY